MYAAPTARGDRSGALYTPFLGALEAHRRRSTYDVDSCLSKKLVTLKMESTLGSSSESVFKNLRRPTSFNEREVLYKLVECSKKRQGSDTGACSGLAEHTFSHRLAWVSGLRQLHLRQVVRPGSARAAAHPGCSSIRLSSEKRNGTPRSSSAEPPPGRSPHLPPKPAGRFRRRS